MRAAPFIEHKGMRFLNVPHAREVFDEVVTHDCYEIRNLPTDAVLLDLGAFYGEATIFACSLGLKALAFEPSLDSMAVLGINLTQNDFCKHNATAMNLAIAHENVPVSHYYRPEHPAGSGPKANECSVFQSIPGITMEKAIGMARASHPRRPLAVKMDIEGAESIAFSKYHEWLHEVDFVMMETHNFDAGTYAELLMDNGFAVKTTGTGVPPRLPWDGTMAGGLVIAKRKHAKTRN